MRSSLQKGLIATLVVGLLVGAVSFAPTKAVDLHSSSQVNVETLTDPEPWAGKGKSKTDPEPWAGKGKSKTDPEPWAGTYHPMTDPEPWACQLEPLTDPEPWA